MKWSVGNAKYNRIRILVVGLATGCLISSCIITGGNNSPPIQATRTVQLGGAMPVDPTLVVQSDNGDIRANGNAPECRIVATITGRGWSQQQAQELVDQVGIDMKTSGQKVIIQANKPPIELANTISISYDLSVPNPCGLELTSHNGAIQIEATQGPIHAESHNGSVEVIACNGPTVARSHNGKITIRQFTGDIEATTNNGGIELVQAESGAPAARIQAVSHNGSIHLTAVPGLSAKAHIRSHNGSIRCDRPISVIGEIDKQNLNGVIGSGAGELSLETSNGSIHIR